jgi:hypothetical protein
MPNHIALAQHTASAYYFFAEHQQMGKAKEIAVGYDHEYSVIEPYQFLLLEVK